MSFSSSPMQTGPLSARMPIEIHYGCVQDHDVRTRTMVLSHGGLRAREEQRLTPTAARREAQSAGACPWWLSPTAASARGGAPALAAGGLCELTSWPCEKNRTRQSSAIVQRRVVGCPALVAVQVPDERHLGLLLALLVLTADVDLLAAAGNHGSWCDGLPMDPSKSAETVAAGGPTTSCACIPRSFFSIGHWHPGTWGSASYGSAWLSPSWRSTFLASHTSVWVA